MATVLRSPGPLVRTKTEHLRVQRDSCFAVLMRSMRPGQGHGEWQRVTTSGYTVVAPSRLEASELIFMLGGKVAPRPHWLDRGDDHDDERYLNWLLQHHFRIEHLHATEVGSFDSDGVCRKTRQVLFHAFVKGWYPDASDLGGTFAGDMLKPYLDYKWRGR